MKQLNQIEIIGCIGNVRLSEVQGTAMAWFSVAVNSSYKDKGHPVIETTWVSVVAVDGQCEGDFSDLGKGDSVHVKGRLRMRKYIGQDGAERMAPEVVAQSVEKVRQ